jgi:hypothetical protein
MRVRRTYLRLHTALRALSSKPQSQGKFLTKVERGQLKGYRHFQEVEQDFVGGGKSTFFDE